MNLTPEEKQRIAEWIRWDNTLPIGNGERREMRLLNHRYDLNDASLVVAELVRRGKWYDFCRVAYFDPAFSFLTSTKDWSDDPLLQFSAWLLTTQSGEATNFFRSFAVWIEEEGK